MLADNANHPHPHAERLARRRLEEGCSADLAAMERLFSAVLGAARNDLEGAIRNGMCTSAEMRRIVTVCATKLRDNANIRFRARFRTYVDSVIESESRALARPRRIALPRLYLGTIPTPAAPRPIAEDFVNTFLTELASSLNRALSDAVAIARGKVIRRVLTSVVRARVRRDIRRIS